MKMTKLQLSSIEGFVGPSLPLGNANTGRRPDRSRDFQLNIYLLLPAELPRSRSLGALQLRTKLVRDRKFASLCMAPHRQFSLWCCREALPFPFGETGLPSFKEHLRSALR